MGKPPPTVVVASDDPVLLDEVVRHLEELPAWRLAGFAATASGLERLLADHTPDAALLSAGIARDLGGAAAQGRAGTRLVVLATEQEPGVLRASLRLGAAFVLWPDERHELRAAVESALPDEVHGRLVAVWGPKGGSGASVLAAHLAAAAAPLVRCTLLDLDLHNGDQRALLGAGDHERTVLDLFLAGDELSPTAAGGVTWRHPAGFGVVFAPGPGTGPLPEGYDGIAPAVGAVRDHAGLVVADLASGLGRLPVETATRSDAVALVVTPELLAMRRARDAARAVGAGCGGPDVGVVLNRWSRGSGLTPADVEAVLGLPVWARVAPQAGLSRAPDLGHLSRSAVRALAPLAELVSGPPAPGGLAALATTGDRQ